MVVKRVAGDRRIGTCVPCQLDRSRRHRNGDRLDRDQARNQQTDNHRDSEADYFFHYCFRYSFETHSSCSLGPTWRNVTSHWNWLKHHECHGFYDAFWAHPHFPVDTVSAMDAAAVAPPGYA